VSYQFDYFRHHRIGLPECIYCEGKSVPILNRMLTELSRKKKCPVLLTRLSKEKRRRIHAPLVRKLDYHEPSGTAFLGGKFPKVPKASVAVVTAGSSDLGVAYEAVRTLDFLGVSARLFADIGVAGLWRLEKNIEAINRHDAIIVIAGMDAAIVSVLGGLTSKPVIAVPTSVGYGTACGGQTALNAMLASCAPGIAAVNIDNGYGAACAAFRVIGRKLSRSPR
jgi:NCAIR mutase (PurE)-related protein